MEEVAKVRKQIDVQNENLQCDGAPSQNRRLVLTVGRAKTCETVQDTSGWPSPLDEEQESKCQEQRTQNQVHFQK